MEDFLARIIVFARQALPISLVAWLAIQLLYQSIRQDGSFFFEGLYTFLAVWGLITIINYNTDGRSSPAISAFAFWLMATGILVFLVRAVVRALSPRRRSGKKFD